MLDVGWSELLLLGIVILVVVAPQDLPRLLRAVGNGIAQIRTAAQDFQRQIERATHLEEPKTKPKHKDRDRPQKT